jgi:hypothetical protein
MHNAVNLQGFLPLGKSNRTDLQVFYQPPENDQGRSSILTLAVLAIRLCDIFSVRSELRFIRGSASPLAEVES